MRDLGQPPEKFDWTLVDYLGRGHGSRSEGPRDRRGRLPAPVGARRPFPVPGRQRLCDVPGDPDRPFAGQGVPRARIPGRRPPDALPGRHRREDDLAARRSGFPRGPLELVPVLGFSRRRTSQPPLRPRARLARRARRSRAGRAGPETGRGLRAGVRRGAGLGTRHRNGLEEPRFAFDDSTGRITFQVEIAPSDRIEVRWRTTDAAISGRRPAAHVARRRAPGGEPGRMGRGRPALERRVRPHGGRALCPVRCARCRRGDRGNGGTVLVGRGGRGIVHESRHHGRGAPARHGRRLPGGGPVRRAGLAGGAAGSAGVPVVSHHGRSRGAALPRLSLVRRIRRGRAPRSRLA